MRRGEVINAVIELVVFYYHEGRCKGETCDAEEGSVYVGSRYLLGGCVGRLEDDDGLGDEGDGGDVEEWVVGEEGERKVENGVEDEDEKDDDPRLGYEGSPWGGVSRIRVWMEREDIPIIRFHPKALPSR